MVSRWPLVGSGTIWRAGQDRSSDSRKLVLDILKPLLGADRQGEDRPIHVLDLATGRDQPLGTLEGLTERPLGLSVSPDGKTIVYPRQLPTNADLMLIENFR